MKNYDLIIQFDSTIERILPEEQSLYEALFNMVHEQNSVASEARHVSLDAARTVAARSLTASVSLAPEVRYFAAIREVTNFLSLATNGSRPNGAVSNTDLLPVGHPESTQKHNLGPTSYRARRGEWFAADSRIENDYVRNLVASAFSANPRTARYAHAMARLHALPTNEIPRDLLINPLTAGIGHTIGNAIKDAIFKGKNSSFWRSLRAKAQLRDEKGRFEYMGGGLNVHVRFPDGNVYQISGKMAGNSTTDGDVELELNGVHGLRDGIYDVPANKTTASRALLPKSALNKVKRTMVPENAFRNDVIDIRDLVAKETPDGWARSNFEEPTPGIDHAPTPDETFTSGDGYNIALYHRPTPALEKYMEDAKNLYDVTTIGSDGSDQLDPNQPIYAVIGSKRGDSEVIGFTNDWASAQKIVSDEDKAHPTTENESLTPEEQATLPKAKLPAEPKAKANLMEESDEEEGPFDPEEGMPDTWEKVGENKFASKDGRFNVDYIFGPSGTKLVYDEDSGETYFEDAGDPVHHFTIKDNKGAGTNQTFRTWEQISAFADRTHQNDLDLQKESALTPEFETPEEDEYYHSLSPLEQVAYNNFGPDSGAVWNAETFIDDYMERMFPGTYGYEDFNHNGFWFNDFVGVSANLTDNEDGTHSGTITQDRTGKVLASSNKIDPNEANEWLNYELSKLFPVPENIKDFDFSKEVKDFDFSNGKNASKFADGLDNVVHHMLANNYDDINSRSYGRNIDEIGELSKAIRNHTYVTDPMPKSNLMEEEQKPKRSPSKGQASLLYSIMKRAGNVPKEIRDQVIAIFNNPENFDMDQWAKLKKMLEENAGSTESSAPSTPNISEAQRKYIGDLIKQRYVTPERRTEILEKLLNKNGASFAKGEASDTIGELLNAPRLNLDNSAPSGAMPKYLKNTRPEANFGPSMEQLVYTEALIENKQIPDNVLKDFMDQYQNMDIVDFMSVIDGFVSYPNKEKYTPKGLYTNLEGDQGASPRQLASFERIFSKGLVSDEEMAELKRIIPNMYRSEVSERLMPLKKLEDAYDAKELDKAIEEGRSTEGLRVPEGYVPPADRPDLKEAEESTAADEKASRTEDEIHAARKKRRKEARNLKRSISRLIQYFNDQRDNDKTLRASGRRIVDRAVADLIDLHTAIDMRRAYPISADKVDERLQHVIDGLNPNTRAYSYGKTMDEGARRALENLASSVHDTIGDYSGYSPNLDDHYAEAVVNDQAGGLDPQTEAVNNAIENAEDSPAVTVAETPAATPSTEQVHGDEIRAGDRIIVGGKERLVKSAHYSDSSGNTSLELEPIDDKAALNKVRYRDYEKIDRIVSAQEATPVEVSPEEEVVLNPGQKPYGAKRLSPKSFQGAALEALRSAKSWQDIRDFFRNNTHFIADTETTGLFDKETPEIQNDATQVTIHKVVGGKIVDTFNSYINPESPISDWVKENVPNGQGGFVNEEFLADKPTAKEIVPKIKEFLGDNPIIVGHNFVGFDDDVMSRLFEKAGETFSPGGYVDTLGLADHLMHDWSKDNPVGPFAQKEVASTNGGKFLSQYKSKSLGSIVSYYKGRNVDGLTTEGAHSSLNDTLNNHVIFQQMLEDAINGDVKNGAENFDFDATENGYDKLLPGYLSRVEEAEKRMDAWLVAKKKWDDWRKGTPESGIEDFLKKVQEAKQTNNTEGTSHDAKGLSTTNADVPENISPVTTSLVQEDKANKVYPPSVKQLQSVERRLQMSGVVDPARAQQIWEMLPHLTSKDIGAIVQEMDLAELKHRMDNKLPIADLIQKRYPAEMAQEILDYLRNGPDGQALGPSSPNLLEETVNPAATLSRAMYAKKVLERILESDKSDVNENDIVSSINALDKAIDRLTPQSNLMSETLDPHPNKYDPADLDKIDLDLSFLPITPTDEGARIIKAIHRGDSVVVLALAGTGKTTTLQGSALAIKKYLPSKRILYVVFNNDMAKEARLRMPDNVEVRTMDSLAYQSPTNAGLVKKMKALSRQYEDNNKPVAGYIEISRYLKVPAEVQLNNGKEISGATTTAIALKGLEEWCKSDDRVIDRKHFSMGDKLGEENYIPYIQELATKIWKNILTNHDPSVRQIKPSFLHLMKNFALNNPDFSESGEAGLKAKPDFIFVDEAQDTNRVFYKIVEDQKDLHKNGIPVTAVGDPNQAIYGWRGAVNALDLYKRDVTLPLTLMFRAGKEIADVGNLVLDIKNTGKERLRGNPNKDGNVVAPGSMTDADAVVVRSNAGGLDEILTLLERNLTPGVPRAFKDDLTSFIDSLKWLYGVGKPSKFPVKKPKKLHEAVLPYEGGTWEDMTKAIAENADPNIARFFSIKNRIESRLMAKGSTSGMYDIFKEIEKGVKGSRVYGVKGFKAPKDGNWGSSGDLGNTISYEVKNKQLRIFNTGRVFVKSITDPDSGTTNNKGILSALGFQCDVKGKTYDWVKDIESNGAKELDQLYTALSGNDIDTTVMTVHRSKGLEFNNVKIGPDWLGPDPEKDPAQIAMGQLPAYLGDDELHNAYVAITRSMSAIDLGSLAWVMEDSAAAKSNREEALNKKSNIKPPKSNLMEEVSEKTNEMAQRMDSQDPDSIEAAYKGIAAFTAGPTLAQSKPNLMSETPPENPSKKNSAAVNEVIQKILEAMDKGIIPWKKPWDGSGNFLPTSGATGKNYKGMNLLFLMLMSQIRGYTGNRWYTKNAIAALGGYVDDEDGVAVLKVIKSEYKVKPVEGLKVKDPKTGEQKDDDGTRVSTRLAGHIVFNEAAVKGITLPPVGPVKEAPPMHEVENILLDSYADHPKIHYVPQDAAYYRPDTDEIYLPKREQFNSTEEHLDTLFHELTHSTAASHRLDRKSDLDLDKYGTHKDVRAREELVAEIGSALLSSIFGVDTSIENIAAYVQSWKKFLESEPNSLYEAASLASKAVDYMLQNWNGHLDEEEEGEFERPEAVDMPIGDITGEDGSSGGLGGGVNYRIEGNRIYLMGDTFNKKDAIKGLSIIPTGMSNPFSFFWDKKANNWSISLKDPAQRIQILNDLKAALS